jgi:hypothetical protein
MELEIKNRECLMNTKFKASLCNNTKHFGKVLSSYVKLFFNFIISFPHAPHILKTTKIFTNQIGTSKL